jgi:hypothetical protein
MASFRLRDLDDLASVLDGMPKDYRKAAIKALRRTARWGKKEVLAVSESTNPRPRAWGTYERGFKVIKSRDGAHLVNTAAHAPFVEEGRQPNKPQPPISEILDWVINKRIELDPKAAKGIAFAIARKIGAKGTEGRFVMARAMPKITARQELELKRAFVELHGKHPRRW